MQAETMRAPRARFTFQCVDADGRERWTETADNLVLNAGKTEIVDKFLKAASYSAAWYLLLKGTGTIAAGDTLASHAGWTELQPYAGSNRPAITWGTTSGGSNTSTTVAVSINATATVAGAGIANAQTGTSGILYNAADFATARSVVNGDTLNVTVTISVS